MHNKASLTFRLALAHVPEKRLPPNMYPQLK